MNKSDEYIESIKIKEPIVGQKVILFGYESGEIFVGEVGKIILIEKENSITIEFQKSNRRFHSCCGMGKKDRCWTVSKRKCSIFEYSVKNKKILKDYLSNRDSLGIIRDNLAKACESYYCSVCPYDVLDKIGCCGRHAVYYGNDSVYNTYKNASLKTT